MAQKIAKYDPQCSFANSHISKSKKLSSKCISYNVSSKHDQNVFKSEEMNKTKNNPVKPLQLLHKKNEFFESKKIEVKPFKEKETLFNLSDRNENQVLISCRRNCRSTRKNLTEGCSRKNKSELSTHKSGK